MVASIGEVDDRNVAAAHDLLAALPLDLALATHDPERAQALVLAMLLDRDARRRQEQVRLLPSDDAALVHEVHAAYQSIAHSDREQRLSLLELAMPALRRLDFARRRSMRELARQLAMADGQLTPFEFALLRSVERHVRLDGELPRRPSGRPDALVQHGASAALVLSVLARTGSRGDEAAAQNAFARGRAALALAEPLQLLPPDRCRIEALEIAVDALAAVSPLGKRNLVQACAEAAGADGVLDADEASLLRALAELWDCPMPLVGNAQPA
jgi:uncharacterized tellurite resistance protein B-like protein